MIPVMEDKNWGEERTLVDTEVAHVQAKQTRLADLKNSARAALQNLVVPT